jgi:hypothetical protein
MEQTIAWPNVGTTVLSGMCWNGGWLTLVSYSRLPRNTFLEAAGADAKR